MTVRSSASAHTARWRPLPQLTADACGVVDKAHVRTKVDIDVPAVTSTHIALWLEKGERSEHSDGFAYPSVPPLVADLLARSQPICSL